MTGLTVLKFLLETLAVLAISYGFYREEHIVKFERKVFRFIKRAVKITVNEIKENRKSKNVSDNIVELKFEEDVETQYDYLLKNVG
ncbi:MAG: hypothetical protein E7522_04210 [Ruminococcaceae bacterium]|nr:hypothetical protein [Oscillospiraceae bacterium]